MQKIKTPAFSTKALKVSYLTLWLSKVISATFCDLAGNHDDNDSAGQTGPP